MGTIAQEREGTAEWNVKKSPVISSVMGGIGITGAMPHRLPTIFFQLTL